MKELVITKQMIKKLEELKGSKLIEISEPLVFKEFKKNTAKKDWKPTWAEISSLIDKGYRYAYSFAYIPLEVSLSVDNEDYNEIVVAIRKIKDVLRKVYLKQKLNCIQIYSLKQLTNVNMNNPNWVITKEVVEELQNNSLNLYYSLWGDNVMYEVNTDTLRKLIDKLTEYIVDPHCSSQVFCLRKEMIKLLNRRIKKGE